MVTGLRLLGFPMQRVFLAARAVFFQLKTLRIVAPIFHRRVIPLFALRA
jgi:hypothetical protein